MGGILQDANASLIIQGFHSFGAQIEYVAPFTDLHVDFFQITFCFPKLTTEFTRYTPFCQTGKYLKTHNMFN